MKLSVVIVNYNVKYYLEQCLLSVYQATRHISTEVFVVDNASTDGSETYITPKKFPGLKYIHNTDNVGFARANNQAIRMAKGEYVLLLNPDTLLAHNTISELMAFMDAHPDAGAAGVKMITSDGSFLPESKRAIPSPWGSFSKLTGLQKLFPHSPYFGGYYLSHLDNDAVHQIEVLPGAFMFIRHTVLKEHGLLDESYFMYGEDIDLSCLMRSGKFANYYVPLPILHYKGESTSKESHKHIRVFYEAMEIFFEKYKEVYSPSLHLVVKTGIKLRMHLAMLVLSFKLMLKRMRPAKPCEPRFLVFGSESSIQYIQNLCKRHKLKAKHHFVVANPHTFSSKHLAALSYKAAYSHVVYDTAAFSYSDIIHLLEVNSNLHLHAGIYNAECHTLVTPQKCYI